MSPQSFLPDHMNDLIGIPFKQFPQLYESDGIAIRPTDQKEVPQLIEMKCQHRGGNCLQELLKGTDHMTIFVQIPRNMRIFQPTNQQFDVSRFNFCTQKK